MSYRNAAVRRLPSAKVSIVRTPPPRSPSPRADAQIAPAISNVAAVLIQHGTGKFRLRDLTDGNLLVNGGAIEAPEVELADGDNIDLGAYVVEFKARRPAPRLPSVSAHGIRLGGLMAWSPKMVRVFQRIHRITNVSLPVVVTGPSGSGKELVARALHETGERAQAPFLAINCGALSPALIESELFGHVKGAFTGATAAKTGAFEACDGGTLFLDEIGELPLDMQPKLLRVLETMTVRRVGGTREVPIRTRVVCATHRDLKTMVERGEFREDLYHRLHVLSVALPSLAERTEDIVPLARFFLRRESTERPLQFTAEAEDALRAYRWPGNVRELRNVIIRASVMAEDDVLDVCDLELSAPESKSDAAVPAYVPPRAMPVPVPTPIAGAASDVLPLRINQDRQRERFIQVLADCNNNRAEAARRLGVAKSTFHAQLQRAGIGLKFDR